jgi:hypothetical protein
VKRAYFIICLVLTCIISKAQNFSAEAWHEGYLVTSEGDTLRGLIKYDMETNIVQLIVQNVVKTYSSYKIYYFEIYDSIMGNFRQFYSIPYEVTTDYELPIIFEVLYEGPLSLLSREAIVQENVTSTSAYWGGSYVQNTVRYFYYFLDKSGNIRLYNRKKSELLAIMSRHQSEVKSFVKSNKLRLDDPRDLIRITAFFNSL